MRLALLALMLATVGCHRERPALLDVPKQCIHINITDFKKPCAMRKDGTAVCDQVVIHADCVQVEKHDQK